MEIEEQRKGAVTVLKPKGPLSQEDVDQFHQRVITVMGDTLGRFVVDASAIPFVDSCGLEVLHDIGEELSQSGNALRLCGVNETVREVLELTELSALFEHYVDANAAVRSFL